MNKLISIIMPVKNGSNYLEEALININKQQMNIEIIVVNDGSTDNTAKIAEKYGCIVINKEKSEGCVKAKNEALKFAKGEYIMFHDHDDVMQEGALKRLYDEIEKDETNSAVKAQLKDFLSPELSHKEAQETQVRKEPYYGLFSGAILIRKSVFDIIGPFDESVIAGDTIDWHNRMDKNNLKIQKLDFVSCYRRIHSSNFGRTNKKQEYKDYLALLRNRISAKN